MTQEARPGLEVDEDLAFQRKEWAAERVGWAAMGLLVAVALTGVTGHGPASAATAGERNGGFWVEYQRFARYQTIENMVVHVARDAVKGNRVRLTLDAATIQQIEIPEITPRPLSEHATGEGVTYIFAAPPAGQAGRYSFALRADGYGPHEIVVGLEGGASHRLGTFTYP